MGIILSRYSTYRYIVRMFTVCVCVVLLSTPFLMFLLQKLRYESHGTLRTGVVLEDGEITADVSVLTIISSCYG